MSNTAHTVQLRPYQQEAVQATLKHFRASDDAAVIALPTGAGKSLVIAELARLAKRKILVLAHVKELVEQNHQKYENYGLKASIFSAGLQRKEQQLQVTFGSVQSVSRNLEQFDESYSLLIIDECHRVSGIDGSQYQDVIDTLKKHNPQLKVLGLTATPYRLESGWVFQNHLSQGRVVSESPSPFKSCIYELPLKKMIDDGYLSPVELIDAPVAFYDFEQLRPSKTGHYREAELNQVLAKSKRATARIIEQVCSRAQDSAGVMIFAATTDHAREIMGYLPPECSALVLGSMNNRARDSVINAFKAKQIKFLVNVAVLTTGFDAPHVDMIVMLRPTESVSLYQQIIGRGLRLSPGKESCQVLDYANNKHRLFNPEVGEPKPSSDSEQVIIDCPACGFANPFWGKLDEQGQLLEHFGRRCQGLIHNREEENEHENADNLQRCDFRFRFKECPNCNAENDTAARQCHQCQHPIVDPDERLKQALGLKNHIVLRCAGMSLASVTGKHGGGVDITYHDEDGTELKERFYLETSAQRHACWHKFLRLHLIEAKKLECFNLEDLPEELIKFQALLRHPDFIIAKQEKYYSTVTDKIFDYEGQYRRANQER